MRKQRNQFDSPVDALIAVSKRISVFEDRYQKTSEEFFDKYSKGQLEDSIKIIGVYLGSGVMIRLKAY